MSDEVIKLIATFIARRLLAVIGISGGPLVFVLVLAVQFAINYFLKDGLLIAEIISDERNSQVDVDKYKEAKEKLLDKEIKDEERAKYEKQMLDAARAILTFRLQNDASSS